MTPQKHDPESLVASRLRPGGVAAMFQTWVDLGFFHYCADPEIIQRTLPVGLACETYPDANGIERAWIGIVAFGMQSIRIPGSPALPWLSRFLETNVRTYVVGPNGVPGVYFYSLDAERLIACDFARHTFGLNYLHSQMQSRRVADRIDYRVHRLDEPHAELKLSFEIGDRMNAPEPGSLDFFLAERYVLFEELRGVLGMGRVWHKPYPLHSANVIRFESSLAESMNLPEGRPIHAMFSPGVDVEVFAFDQLDVSSDFSNIAKI